MDYATVNQRTNTYAAAEMMAHAQDVQVLNLFGDTLPMPKNKAKSVTARRWVPKAIPADADGNPVPITEGVNPAGQDLTYEDVEVAIKQFGGFTEITDVVTDLAEDDVRQHATEANGEQAATTFELECWGVIRGGTNVKYSNGTARNEVNTPINATMLAGIERTLRSNKGKEVKRMLTGSPFFNTTPIPRAYMLIGHTDLKHDIEQLDGFSGFEQYASQDKNDKMTYEVGRYGSFRIMLSPTLTKWADAGGDVNGMVSTSGTKADVYPFICFAEHAYFHTRVKGIGKIIPMIVQPNTPDSNDRLGLKGSVGWKAYYAAAIQNNAWLIRGECAATNL